MGTSRPGRIHVIGIGGSGKTRLARACSDRLGIEVTNLDQITAVDGRPLGDIFGPERYDLSQAAALAIAARDTWITEGVYCGWTAPLMERADVIVWLDVKPSIAVARIVRRHVGLSIAGANEFRGLRLLRRFAWGVLRDAHHPAATVEQLRQSMDYNSRATTAVFLRPYEHKVVQCRSNRAVDQVVQALR